MSGRRSHHPVIGTLTECLVPLGTLHQELISRVRRHVSSLEHLWLFSTGPIERGSRKPKLYRDCDISRRGTERWDTHSCRGLNLGHKKRDSYRPLTSRRTSWIARKVILCHARSVLTFGVGAIWLDGVHNSSTSWVILCKTYAESRYYLSAYATTKISVIIPT